MASLDLSSITGTYHDHEFDDDACEAVKFSATITQQVVYGRSKETLILLNAYTRLLQTNQAQTVLLHGESGSGKTALVNVLRDRVCDGTPAYFVTGKYFQNSGGVQEAHSAIMAAFSDLCDLVDQSDDTDEKRRSQIKEALGSDAQLLVKSISNLSPFVRDDIIDARIVPETFAGKFKLACKTFLHAMSCEEHPVVIFLDDIQWADEGSQQLIEMFLQDDSLRNVMMILAYRDEEAVQVERILAHARGSIDMQLSYIDTGAIHQMVSSITGSSSEDVKDLGELVAKRTLGNPYHVMVFMEMIQREGLLIFDSTRDTCTFNVDEIQRSVMACKSLADLLAQKIDILAFDITETLKVASLLGYRFKESVLLEVASAMIEEKQSISERNFEVLSTESSCQSVITSLANAVNDGFIETTIDGYQFTHDKVQASFQSMIDAPEQDRLHLLIGRAYLASCDENHQNKYNAAVHLNRAPSFIKDHKERIVLARINANAAKYCEEKSAFIQAVKMLQKGLNVIGEQDRWADDNFDLTFEMMESLARTQLIVGDFEGCKKTAGEALDHAKSVDAKINLLLIDIEGQMAGIEVDDSLASGFRALRTLGVSLPRKVKLWHVVAKLVKVRRMFKSKTDDDIINLPVTEDRLLNSTVKLLMFVCSYCLVKNNVNAGIYAALLATELTLQNGLMTYSSGALVLYGVAEQSLGNADRASKYGTLALAVLERVSCKEAECFTVGFTMTTITNHKQPFIRLIGPLSQAADSGYQRGDVVFSSYTSAQSLLMQNFLRVPLATVEASLRKRCSTVSDLGQDGMILWFQPLLQYVINIQSDVTTWQDISVLSGEIMDENEYFRKVDQAQHLVLIAAGLLVKAHTASFFDQYSLAASFYEKGDTIEKTVQITYAALFYYWNAARTYLCLYDEVGKRPHLRKGRRFTKLLKRLKVTGCPTAVPLVAFLDAEQSARRKYIDEVTLHSIYQQGIKCVAEHDCISVEAILNEKAGFHFARRGWRSGAEQYFNRALHIYKNEWGATAKYNWLMEKSRYALVDLADLPSANPTGNCITVKAI